jgi:hypothetical protein
VNRQQFAIKEVNTEEELLALKETWLELEEPVTYATLGSSFEITRLAWQCLAAKAERTFGYNKKLLILLVLDANQPVAIVPLVKVQRDHKVGPFTKSLSSIEFLGHSLLSRYFRFFYDIVTKHPSKELTQAIIEWLYANHKFDILHLAYISEESPNFDLSSPDSLYSTSSTVVDINRFQSFEQYKQIIYSESLRQNIRTAFNRAAKDSLTIDRQAEWATGATLGQAFHPLDVKLHKVPFVQDSYQKFLLSLSLAGRVRAVTVYANDKLIAHRLYATFAHGQFEIDTNRDWTYKRLELGSLLIDKAIQDSFERKLDIHCCGLYGGLHTERFATRLIKSFKYVRAGNTILGGIANKLVRLQHQEEHPIVQPPPLPEISNLDSK